VSGGSALGRDGQPPLQWRSIRVPLRLVERAYGRDNVDNAADDIVAALRQVSDSSDQFPYRFGIDTSHPNPWYHAMIFDVEGMPEPAYARFVELLAELRLVENDRQSDTGT
jgi:hypothetical protein